MKRLIFEGYTFLVTQKEQLRVSFKHTTYHTETVFELKKTKTGENYAETKTAMSENVKRIEHSSTSKMQI